MTAPSAQQERRRRSILRRAGIAALILAALYLGLAYALLPALWRHHERQKGLDALPMTTVTALGIPGDALNVGLEGDEADVICAMAAAGWSPADPVTLKTSLKITGSVLFDRPYAKAPVSPLFYQGRREDLAFEKAAGRSADKRHHVRFWKVLDSGEDGLPVWLGAATFDRGVGVSHYTGQITHHIAPDIDAERDLVSADLAAAKKVDATYETSGVEPSVALRNGGGDFYYTDGEIRFSKLTKGCDSRNAQPETLPTPPLVETRGWVWRHVVTPIAALAHGAR
ncbi:MAG TPA: LssY C-terminal domain-containing protein [Roseiarcus sp.]|nr:LssY C-terminal domain-containing protein [Roseiarcus sp.]